MSLRTMLAPIRPRPIMPSCIFISSVSRLLRGNDFLAGFENLNKLLISASNFGDCVISSYLACAPVNEWTPEARPAHGEANEARNCSGGSEPLADFVIVLAPAENDTADSVPAAAAGSSHNPFAVFLTLEPFDLPHIRFNPRILKFLNGLSHQPRTNLQIVGLLSSFEAIKLRLLHRDQQFEHKLTGTAVAVQIFRQSPQTSCLPPVKNLVALGVVTNQDLAEGQVKVFNMLLEIFAVFEVEFILTTLLRRATGYVSVFNCISENRGAELLVNQDSSLIFGNAVIDGSESVVDYALRSSDLGRLLRAQRAVPSEHLLLERGTMVKRQNVEGFIEAEIRHPISLDF